MDTNVLLEQFKQVRKNINYDDLSHNIYSSSLKDFEKLNEVEQFKTISLELYQLILLDKYEIRNEYEIVEDSNMIIDNNDVKFPKVSDNKSTFRSEEFKESKAQRREKKIEVKLQEKSDLKKKKEMALALTPILCSPLCSSLLQTVIPILPFIFPHKLSSPSFLPPSPVSFLVVVRPFPLSFSSDHCYLYY